jgi:hypothetical protein
MRVGQLPAAAPAAARSGDPSAPVPGLLTTPFKLEHDAAQLRWVAGQPDEELLAGAASLTTSNSTSMAEDEGGAHCAQRGEPLRRRLLQAAAAREAVAAQMHAHFAARQEAAPAGARSRHGFSLLRTAQWSLLGDAYNRPVHLPPLPQTRGGAAALVRPDFDGAALQRRFVALAAARGGGAAARGASSRTASSSSSAAPPRAAAGAAPAGWRGGGKPTPGGGDRGDDVIDDVISGDRGGDAAAARAADVGGRALSLGAASGDGVLEGWALAALHRHLVGATVFWDVKAGGYLGAYAETGLHGALFFQVLHSTTVIRLHLAY